MHSPAGHFTLPAMLLAGARSQVPRLNLLVFPGRSRYKGEYVAAVDDPFFTGQQAIRFLHYRLRQSQLNFGDPWTSAFQWYDLVLLSANRRPDSFRVLYAAALHSSACSVIHACALVPCPRLRSRSINISHKFILLRKQFSGDGRAWTRSARLTDSSLHHYTTATPSK